MEPPDAHDEATAVAFQHADAKSAAGLKHTRMVQPSLADIYVISRDLQQCSGHRVGNDLSKNDRFCALFGCGANIALLTWLKLIEHDFASPRKPSLSIYSEHSSLPWSTRAPRLHVLQQVTPMVPLTLKLFASTSGQ
jgi:hypothetical protein